MKLFRFGLGPAGKAKAQCVVAGAAGVAVAPRAYRAAGCSVGVTAASPAFTVYFSVFMIPKI